MLDYRLSELYIRSSIKRLSGTKQEKSSHATLISNKERSFLNIAIKTAEDSDCSQRHGAVVTSSGRVMSIASNRFRNCPQFVPSDIPDGKGTIFSYHAEKRAIDRGRGDTIYIARINSSGEPRLSMPCEACMEIIIDAGFRKVVFTTHRGAAKMYL